eukprot:CAMPEP_0113500122 /NCGR_PEP_ID=MMETSP0014_2-20120614/32134_1 /TAXON_ID=2857 /ORGANISM="Nitzschia sp." /LENGTH=475 /DNA_ID=CAMNT_0000394385 /DNA_START=49 /DNA_END=1476 /DNA_ORIENTATION=- /assembly_acc=CAM_ASM_000159
MAAQRRRHRRIDPRLCDKLNTNIYVCYKDKGCWAVAAMMILMMVLTMGSSSSSSSSSYPSSILTAVAAEAEAVVENTESASQNFWEFADCTLGCQNGGRCRFVKGSRDQLAKMAQSGYLIETCDCLEGFGGLACELPEDECALPDKICSMTGRFCDRVVGGSVADSDNSASPTGSVLEGFFTGFSGGNSVIPTAPATENTVPEKEQWTCDCSAADERSEFAGTMCRNPITEYCQRGPYDPHLPTINFCTNGGRCESDFSPTSKSLFSSSTLPPSNNDINNTSSNKCRCPADFYGPHCEFLKIDDNSENSGYEQEVLSSSSVQSSIAAKKKTPGENFLLTVFALTVVALAAALILKRRKNSGRVFRRRRLSYNNNTSDNGRFGVQYSRQSTTRGRGGRASSKRQNYCDVVEGGIAKSGNSIMYIPNIGASAFIPCPFDDGIILPLSSESAPASSSESSDSSESEPDEMKNNPSDQH